MSKFSREKGKRGERALASELREALPELAPSIRRGWQAREGCDDADVLGVPGFWFENKSGKKPNPRAALEQAIEEAMRSDARTPSPHARISKPVAVIRDDRKEPFAVMRWDDLKELVVIYVRHEDCERCRE